eukprot:6217217-Alexandrium_andersonii.AAC.1
MSGRILGVLVAHSGGPSTPRRPPCRPVAASQGVARSRLPWHNDLATGSGVADDGLACTSTLTRLLGPPRVRLSACPVAPTASSSEDGADSRALGCGVGVWVVFQLEADVYTLGTDL